MTVAGSPALDSTARPVRGGRRLSLNWLGVAPFFAYVGLFLLLPTAILTVGAFGDKDGNFTLSNLTAIGQPYLLRTFVGSTIISLISALVGAIAGALLAYAVATGNPRGTLRRVVTSAAGVFAQFGGVTLVFAFIATLPPAGRGRSKLPRSRLLARHNFRIARNPGTICGHKGHCARGPQQVLVWRSSHE